MAKAVTRSFVAELGTISIFKRNQGRITRQLTAAGIGLIFVVFAWSLVHGPLLVQQSNTVKIVIGGIILAAGGWLTFRIVNYPPFAEFLISVEGEMHKVTWSAWPELWRAVIVVLCTMVFLGLILAVYDFVWATILRAIHVIQ